VITPGYREYSIMRKRIKRNRLSPRGRGNSGGNSEDLATHRQTSYRKKDFYTVKQVADALRATGGIMTQAANLLKDATGLGHLNKSDMIRRYIDQYPELQAVVRSIESETLDLAESKLIAAMNAEGRKDHLRAVCFYLKHKGRGRGYVGRQEVTGADGQPLYPERHIDLSRLTDKELADLERLHAKAEIEPPARVTGGTPTGSVAGNGRDRAGAGSA